MDAARLISQHDEKTAETFAAAADRYVNSRLAIGLKPGSIEDYRDRIRLHLLPAFGSSPLAQVEPEQIERWIAEQRHAGASTTSIRHYLSLMSSIFRYEIRRGRCRRNPISEADIPRPDQRVEIRYLTITELETLLAAVPSDPLGLVERPIYATAAMTGLRRGELLALRWGDVDFPAGLLRVRRSYRKGRFDIPKTRSSARAVPFGLRVRTELEQHLARTSFGDVEDLVFGMPHSGGVYDPSYMTKRFRAARRRAGLRPVRFHDLRHTFGTQMAAAGAPLRSIQAWLGHSDYKTTLIYADYVPDITGAAAFAARAFGEVAPPHGQSEANMIAA